MARAPDFEVLWTQALNSAKAAGDMKSTAVLLNHSQSKERICRSLGIIGVKDIQRIAVEMKKRVARNT